MLDKSEDTLKYLAGCSDKEHCPEFLGATIAGFLCAKGPDGRDVYTVITSDNRMLMFVQPDKFVAVVPQSKAVDGPRWFRKQ